MQKNGSREKKYHNGLKKKKIHDNNNWKIETRK